MAASLPKRVKCSDQRAEGERCRGATFRCGLAPKRPSPAGRGVQDPTGVGPWERRTLTLPSFSFPDYESETLNLKFGLKSQNRDFGTCMNVWSGLTPFIYYLLFLSWLIMALSISDGRLSSGMPSMSCGVRMTCGHVGLTVVWRTGYETALSTPPIRSNSITHLVIVASKVD